MSDLAKRLTDDGLGEAERLEIIDTVEKLLVRAGDAVLRGTLRDLAATVVQLRLTQERLRAASRTLSYATDNPNTHPLD